LWEYFLGKMRPLRVTTWVGAAALWFVAPAAAEEHPLVERARQAADRTEFEAARAMLSELPAELGLTAADLRAVLLLRADLDYALGDIEAMERDLALVARFTSLRELPRDLPPTQRERIRVHLGAEAPVFLEARAVRDGATVRVSLRHTDPDALVRRVRLFTRGDRDAPWLERAVDGGAAELAGDECSELYAELIGLGGAVLARSGSREEPLAVAAPRRRVRAWPFVVAASVVVVGLAVGLSVGLTMDDDRQVQVGAPVVAW
jgi:hypothetical protein